jgi:hypothetical protein
MPYYNALRPKTLSDVFSSPSCSIAIMNKEFGEVHLRAFMVKVLNQLVDYFSVGKTMGATQIAQTADLIIEEFYYLKPDDFKLCFNRAKKGLYGKVYDRIDGLVIFEWLNGYVGERLDAAQEETIREAAKYKEDRTPEAGYNALREFKMYDFKPKFKKKTD